MTRSSIVFFIAAVLAFVLSVPGANSASFNATSALRDSIADAGLVQKIHRSCHTDCRWGRVQVGNSTVRLCHRNAWSCAFAT